MRFSANQVESKGAYSWEERKKRISQLALRKKGVLRTKDIEVEFGLVHRTALNWLHRLVKEDMLTPIKPNKRVVEYQLKGCE